MYATCLFCHAALGANESIEKFPVGKRLAFDQAKGRLWVVCTKCERWNLSPLDERWDAIEEAERAYRDTKKRVATDNVGLARLADGTDLIRIGAPLLPEFAAWRYGDTFGRRRRRRALFGASALVAGGGTLGAAAIGLTTLSGATLGLMALVGAPLMAFLPHIALQGWLRWSTRSRRLTVVANDGARIKVSPAGVHSAVVSFHRLSTDDPGQLAVTVSDGDFKKPVKVTTFIGVNGVTTSFEHRATHIDGQAGIHALSAILAATNSFAGSAANINAAIGVVEASSTPYLLLSSLTSEQRKQSDNIYRQRAAPPFVRAAVLPAPIRLALEMSLHEADERRALEGELHELEQRWKEAEEIANVADGLTLPEGMNDSVEALRRKAPYVSNKQSTD